MQIAHTFVCTSHDHTATVSHWLAVMAHGTYDAADDSGAAAAVVVLNGLAEAEAGDALGDACDAADDAGLDTSICTVNERLSTAKVTQVEFKNPKNPFFFF